MPMENVDVSITFYTINVDKYIKTEKKNMVFLRIRVHVLIIIVLCSTVSKF